MSNLRKLALNVFARARAWLNGPGKDNVLIIWQCLAAGAILWAIVAQSISAGSFPPKKVDDIVLLLVLYGIILWCILALLAGVAILLKKAWGWWLEFFICALAVFVYLPYMWLRGDKTPNSFVDWVSLFGAFIMSAYAIHGINDLYRKARRETSMKPPAHEPNP